MNNFVSRMILGLSWLLAVGSLAGITLFYSGESTQFFGIADNQEQTILFTRPVQIASFGFVPGQEVAPGDLIVAVRQPELEAQLQGVSEQIQALRFGNIDARASMRAEIIQLQNQLRVKVAELDSETRNMQQRASATRQFLTQIGNSESDGSESAAIQNEIDSLEARKQAMTRGTHAQIADLKNKLEKPERPVDARIAELTKHYAELERQYADLRVEAQLAGRVGSVLFKVGDTVPPYQPIVTVHSLQPAFVKAYIHEQVSNSVRLGQSVWVRASHPGQSTVWHEGLVESLGSRIVEFPQRLKVNPMAQAWGREVVIQLRDQHTLLLGEKVSVHITPPGGQITEFKALLASVFP